ncbi:MULTISPECIES: ATP-binding cassette domain-containing protein [Burkholderiaceae]|uniref:ATP-binding cassette domain-containing protein n=1 Tax=Burkholderiaceae TaxID=119060 RepID=UPI000978C4F9|nr:ATP-binding cassette domain-containing protein [Burkholderia sp. b13]
MNGQQTNAVICCVDVVIRVRDDATREVAPSPAWFWRAVDGVAFAIGQDESVGLVGESGYGKSTLSRATMRHDSISRGESRFDDLDVVPFGA